MGTIDFCARCGLDVVWINRAWNHTTETGCPHQVTALVNPRPGTWFAWKGGRLAAFATGPGHGWDRDVYDRIEYASDQRERDLHAEYLKIHGPHPAEAMRIVDDGDGAPLIPSVDRPRSNIGDTVTIPHRLAYDWLYTDMDDEVAKDNAEAALIAALRAVIWRPPVTDVRWIQCDEHPHPTDGEKFLASRGDGEFLLCSATMMDRSITVWARLAV